MALSFCMQQKGAPSQGVSPGDARSGLSKILRIFLLKAAKLY